MSEASELRGRPRIEHVATSAEGATDVAVGEASLAKDRTGADVMQQTSKGSHLVWWDNPSQCWYVRTNGRDFITKEITCLGRAEGHIIEEEKRTALPNSPKAVMGFVGTLIMTDVTEKTS